MRYVVLWLILIQIRLIRTKSDLFAKYARADISSFSYEGAIAKYCSIDYGLVFSTHEV